MSGGFTDADLTLMAVAASMIAPGESRDLDELRNAASSRYGMYELDVNLSVRELTKPNLLGRTLLEVSTDRKVQITEEGWDWISTNRNMLIKIVEQRTELPF